MPPGAGGENLESWYFQDRAHGKDQDLKHLRMPPLAFSIPKPQCNNNGLRPKKPQDKDFL
jgi:hypothetical protein